MFIASLLALLVFGIIHSLLAALGVKALARRAMGGRAFEGFYRLLYNLFSLITFAPVALLILAAPAEVLWRAPMPWAGIMLGVQAVAAVCLLIAVLQADPLRFAGISQALAYLRNDPLPLPAERLQVSGFYSLVRHPLYLFSLLALWPAPIMTDAYLGFLVGVTIYFVVGSRLEERRLAQDFGAAYTAYQRRVPWLIPWPRPPLDASPRRGTVERRRKRAT